MAPTSLGPMMLEAGFSGATADDIRPTGTVSVSMEGYAASGMLLVVEGKGREVQLKSETQMGGKLCYKCFFKKEGKS